MLLARAGRARRGVAGGDEAEGEARRGEDRAQSEQFVPGPRPVLAR
ncbi:hypothetical protein ACFQ2B_04520 [Streptomyces stramineus]